MKNSRHLSFLQPTLGDQVCIFACKKKHPIPKKGFKCWLEHSCNIDHGSGTAEENDKTICEDIDECLSSPCQNGGTCRNMDGDYYCSCNCNWVGKNCEGNLCKITHIFCKKGENIHDWCNHLYCLRLWVYCITRTAKKIILSFWEISSPIAQSFRRNLLYN